MRAVSKRAIAAAAIAAGIISILIVSGIRLSPVHIRVPEGQEFSISTGPSWAGSPWADPPDSLLFGKVDGKAMSFTPIKTGRAEVQLRLLNTIPVRRYVVDVVPETLVMPGGQSVGILVASIGVRVMGMYPVVGTDGGRYMPARDGGLVVGDTIVRVGRFDVSDPTQLEQAVNAEAANGPLTVGVRRGERSLELRITAALTDEGYRIGVYAKDNAAGVGTLSFWDPTTGRYGALGHVVSDSSTGREIKIDDGRLVSAAVTSVDSSTAGKPGEKLGAFRGIADSIGSVDTNCAVGIYGYLSAEPSNELYTEPIPVALASAVTEGPAKMLTVMSGSTIEEFNVEIIKVNRTFRPGGRNMVIRVTDSQLLERTGGIVQGMSGSPIIQDGKLVGAVTHVFVSDPARGYAVFAEQMLEAAGLLQADAPTA